jgi:competence protein ComEC
MSFAAVTSIVLFVNHSLQQPDQPLPPPSLVNKSKKWLLDSMSVSIIALLATAPISLYHFKQISLLSPVTTILAAPLICFWALPLGLAASLLAPWFPVISGLLFSTGAIGLQGASLVTGWMAALPFAAWQLPPPSLPVIAFYYLATLLLLFSTKSRLFLASTAILFFLMMTSSTFVHFRPARENSAMVTFIDIGQGNSTLLELPGNKNILVDGGGSSSLRFNPGEQIITPFLWHKGIRYLDAVIISHVHQDHYNGLESVIRNFKPSKVWINGSPETSFLYKKILKAASDVGAEVIVPEEKTVLIESGPVRLSCMSSLHLRKDLKLEENNRSLLIRLEVAGKTIILPGDLMVADGEELQKKGITLASDVLLAPHHGSRYSAGYDLARLGKPDWLVVSASPFYAGKFPDLSFVSWCKGEGIELLNTAELGSVSFLIAGDGQISWQLISAKAEKNPALTTDKKVPLK